MSARRYRVCRCGAPFPRVHNSNVPLCPSCRFWSRVDTSGGERACWPWTTGRRPRGYGRFWKAGARKMVAASREAWRLLHGDPGPLGVLHTCDNPPCCNPRHLFLGTAADNAADKIAKGRANPPRGEAHKRARLTDAVVRQIRAAYSDPTSHATVAELAARFGVSITTIRRVGKRQGWRHVA